MVAEPEMAITPELAVERVTSIPEYVEMFKKAFQKEEITFDNIAKAIGAFEAGLVTPSKFDDFLNGNLKALNKKEQEGLKTFIDVGCASCHNGVGVGGGSMQKFPLMGEYAHSNLGDFKGNKDGLVKVPTLRNITKTAPYMHNGAIWSLREAVATMGDTQLGKKLEDKEIDSIMVFLSTLDGRMPKITYPILPASTDKTPQPIVK